MQLDESCHIIQNKIKHLYQKDIAVSKAALQAANLKVTQPRLKVLAIFEKHPDEHLSAEAVFNTLKQHGDNVSIATVYRVLNHFESAGILQKLHLGHDQSVYELAHSGQHGHIICSQCHQIQEFFDDVIQTRQQAIIEASGGQLIRHHTVLYVICATCRNKQT